MVVVIFDKFLVDWKVERPTALDAAQFLHDITEYERETDDVVFVEKGIDGLFKLHQLFLLLGQFFNAFVQHQLGGLSQYRLEKKKMERKRIDTIDDKESETRD